MRRLRGGWKEQNKLNSRDREEEKRGLINASLASAVNEPYDVFSSRKLFNLERSMWVSR